MTYTSNLRQDEIEARAARAMLAALKESLPFVAAMEPEWARHERSTRLAQWRKLKDIIAAAEAAGIKVQS